MSQLVVTVYSDGSIETLLKDKVLDTRKFADRRTIERISEILPTNDGQHFLVRWLKGPLVGTKTIWTDNQYLYSLHDYSTDREGHPLWFGSYEEGVEFEVASVNSLRLKGYSFQ